MAEQDRFQIGVVTQPHGVHGEVKVFPTTDDPAKFKKLKKAYLQTMRETKEVELEGAKFFKNMVILKIKGVETMDEAQLLKQASLWVDREHAVPLKKNEYYRSDLIGIQIYEHAQENRLLGTLTDVLETGANDVYEMTLAQSGEKIYLPAILECIKLVDIEKGRMEIFLMPGLMNE